MNAELTILVGQKKSVMEIRDFLSGEFEPLPLADLMDYFHAERENWGDEVECRAGAGSAGDFAVKGKKPTPKKSGGDL